MLERKNSHLSWDKNVKNQIGTRRVDKYREINLKLKTIYYYCKKRKVAEFANKTRK